jgi:hypothetical protein
MASSLADLVTAELAQPVDPRVTRLATAIAQRYGAASLGVLFYGSCLRQTESDGLMLDFYLIVDDYRAAYGGGWLTLANRLIPPNVFPFGADGLAAKYAVLSIADFERLCRPDADNVSVWARFAQPVRLVWAAGGADRKIAACVTEAVITLFRLTIPMLAAQADHRVADIWEQGFELTYAAELRAERAGRGGSIIAFDPMRYELFGNAALAEIARRQGVGLDGEIANHASPDALRRRWRALQRRGKWLTLLRLAKATTTFAGGIDYLAWKINRHAGTKITIKPWQRRWPILGAFILLPRLWRGGAVR